MTKVLIKDKNKQVYIHFLVLVFVGGWEGLLLCSVEVRSEKISLESFAEDGE